MSLTDFNLSWASIVYSRVQTTVQRKSHFALDDYCQRLSLENVLDIIPSTSRSKASSHFHPPLPRSCPPLSPPLPHL